MFDHRITRGLAALVVAGSLVACAADAEPRASGMREGKGKAGHHERADREGGHQHGTAKPGKAHQGTHRGSAGDPAGGKAGGGSGGSDSSGAGPATAAQPVSRPSCRDDSSGDLDSSGSAPSYVDVTRGCLRTEGSQLRLEATTAGSVPARTPDQNTQLAYGFELTPPSGSTFYVHAQAERDGWATYLSRGNGQHRIGRPSIDGGRVVLTLPIAELDGAQHLEWALESSWLESGLVSTSYAFDSAPNIGTVPFDR